MGVDILFLQFLVNSDFFSLRLNERFLQKIFKRACKKEATSTAHRPISFISYFEQKSMTIYNNAASL
jgi:hypothetical protein